MKRQKQSYYERFMAMTDAQRDAEVARFDREDLAPGKPLSPRMRRQLKRAAKRGRPPKPPGERVARVLVSLPPALLRQADDYAQARGLTRAALFAKGLRKLIAEAA